MISDEKLKDMTDSERWSMGIVEMAKEIIASRELVEAVKMVCIMGKKVRDDVGGFPDEDSFLDKAMKKYTEAIAK